MNWKSSGLVLTTSFLTSEKKGMTEEFNKRVRNFLGREFEASVKPIIKALSEKKLAPQEAHQLATAIYQNEAVWMLQYISTHQHPKNGKLITWITQIFQKYLGKACDHMRDLAIIKQYEEGQGGWGDPGNYFWLACSLISCYRTDIMQDHPLDPEVKAHMPELMKHLDTQWSIAREGAAVAADEERFF